MSPSACRATLGLLFGGPPTQPIDFVGRHERLTDDLCTALPLAGEAFDAAALRGYQPVNATDYERPPSAHTGP